MKRILTLGIALLVAVAAVAQEAPKKYGIKSGEFTSEVDMMGQKVVSTTYFSDYGNLQLSKVKMNMMGMTMDMGTLMRDGKTYTINYADKTVQEAPTQESINYMDLNDEIVAKYKVKSEGVEEVAGKPCLIFTAEINQMGQTAKVKASVWEGIPMKSVASVMGMDLVNKVTEVKEYDVDLSVFDLPKF